MSPSASTRLRRLIVASLLLALPACGLSEYESLMQKAQDVAERYREEQKYLDAPVMIPTEKDKDDHEVALADVFFRPPKGIGSTAKQRPGSSLIWQYSPKGSSDFSFVDMAFADDSDKDFAGKVVQGYNRTEQVPTPEHKQPWPFDGWEFIDSQFGLSINIYKAGSKQIAVVFAFRKDKRDALRKAMDLSLQSMSDKTARQRYNQKTPWKLDK